MYLNNPDTDLHIIKYMEWWSVNMEIWVSKIRILDKFLKRP